jgi:peptide/nickel transport system ATP-binding protein
MYLGRIIESGETERIINDPVHPYAKALIGAAPEPDPFREREHVEIKGSIPDPINLPSGCRFKGRCPEREAISDHVDPALESVETKDESGSPRQVACHAYYDDEDIAAYESALRSMESVPEEVKRNPHREVPLEDTTDSEPDPDITAY